MEEIKKFRKTLKLSTKEFAGTLGISKSLCEKIESGDREPSRNFCSRLKKTYPEFDINIFFKE